MNIPNTFVVGAPKCGTTALCSYLESHPNVFMSEPKEPHYFAHEEMPGRKQYFNNLDEYIALFRQAKPEHQIIMEGSVWYLFCQHSINKIYDFNPDSRLIVLLRRPDEMVHSYHSQALISYNEDIHDFETAWYACNSEVSRPIPKLCDEPKVLEYDKIANYGTQLTRLLSKFPKEQVLIILFEDLTMRTEETYTDVLRFLELPNIHPTNFKKINESKIITNKAIGRLLTKPPAKLISAINIFKAIFQIKRLNIKHRLLGSLSKKQIRAPLSNDLKTKIIRNYENEIKKTQTILQRDLSDWLQ